MPLAVTYYHDHGAYHRLGHGRPSFVCYYSPSDSRLDKGEVEVTLINIRVFNLKLSSRVQHDST